MAKLKKFKNESSLVSRRRKKGKARSPIIRIIKGPLVDPIFYKALPRIIGAHREGNKLRGDGSGLLKPLAASFDISRRCNLGCVGCYEYVNSNQQTAQRELTLEQWESKFDSLENEFNIIHATYVGGEPMFERKIKVQPGLKLPTNGRFEDGGQTYVEERWRIVEAGMKRFPYNLVVTNAAYPWDIPDLDGGNVAFAVSIDGTEKFHDAVRGQGNYQRSKAKILSRPDLDFNITTVLNRYNHESIRPLVEEWLDVPNVYGIAFSIGTKIDGQRQFNSDGSRGSTEADGGYCLPWDMRDRAIERVLEIQEEYPGFVFPSKEALDLMTEAHFREAIGHDGDLCLSKLGGVLSLDSQGNEKSPCVLGGGVDCNSCGCIIPYSSAAGREVSPLKKLDTFMAQFTHYR